MINHASDSKIMTILHFFTSLCLFLNTGCFIYFLSKQEFKWNIKFGENIKSSSVNVGYYINISALVWVLISFFFGIGEICMIFDVEFFMNSVFQGLFRPILYISMGLISIGICNDLGIFAGGFILIMAVIWLILISFRTCNPMF